MNNPQYNPGPMPGNGPHGPAPRGPMPPPPPAPGAKRKTPWLTIAMVAGAFVFGVVIGTAAGGADTTTPTAAGKPATKTVEVPGPTKTVEVEVPGPTVTVTAKPAGPSGSIDGNGTFQVGAEVKPGRYKGKADPDGIGMCYVARLDSDGEIIDNQLSEGQVLITIKASDDAVETKGCTTLERVS